jgi:hypothetical protein
MSLKRGIRRFLNMSIQLHQLQKESCRYITASPPTRIVNLQYQLVFLVLPAKREVRRTAIASRK